MDDEKSIDGKLEKYGDWVILVGLGAIETGNWGAMELAMGCPTKGFGEARVGFCPHFGGLGVQTLSWLLVPSSKLEGGGTRNFWGRR